MRSCFILPALLSFTLYWLLVSASITNRTIDDTFGDPVTGFQVEYTGNWNLGQSCSGCDVHPDKASAFAGTWHDTTSNNPNTTSPHYATLKFNGTAIWVYLILANNASTGVTIFTNASFELDGKLVHVYGHIPDPSQGSYLYNVSAFQQSNLEIAEHTLVMTAVQGSQPSLLLFDYAVYTFDDGEPSGTTSTTSLSASVLTTSSPRASASGDGAAAGTHRHGAPTGAIVGGVVGGLALLALIGLYLGLSLRRRRYHVKDVDLLDDTPLGGGATPFVASSFISGTFQPGPPPPSAGSLSADTTPTSFIDSTSVSIPSFQRDHKYQTQDFGKPVTVVSPKPWQMDTRSDYTQDTSTSTVYSSSSRSKVTSMESDAGLNRDVAALRVEIARLAAETRGIAEARSDPPPAYH